MSIFMSASSQTPHSIPCVAGARPNFAAPKEINRILTGRISDRPFTTGRSGGKAGKVPEIRDGQGLTHIAAKIRG